MKIVITGATGQVGQLLIPLLRARQVELILVGRKQSKVKDIYPWAQTEELDQLPKKAQEFDALIHLAAVNNNTSVDEQEYIDGNVEYLEETLKYASKARIKSIVYFSTTHALDSSNNHPYAKSKRQAQQVINSVDCMATATLFLPYIYGSSFIGKLSFLNSLPSYIAKPLFACLSCLKPVVHVNKVVDFVAEYTQKLDQNKNVILTDDKNENWIYCFTKRAIDLSISIGVIAVFWWVFLIVWVLVKLDSQGPGLFVQPRVGRNLKNFNIYKFRTMFAGTTVAGTHEVSEARVTRLGKILRKYKLDELPQLFNVIKNELSIVGPRPCLPTQTDVIGARLGRDVFTVKPGVTGCAQLDGIDMSSPSHLSVVDDEYIKLRTIPLELSIIIKTALGVGNRDNVRRAA